MGTGGFSSGAAGVRHPWTVPGVLRIGSQVSPNTLDPLLAANTTENMIDRLIFDVLISTDASGRRDVPMLAATVPRLENGGISRDGLTLTYHCAATCAGATECPSRVRTSNFRGVRS